MTVTNTDYVRARIAPGIKKQAEAVLANLGLSHADAIRIYYKQIIAQQGIPFSLHVPNEETANAIREARNGKGVRVYKTLDNFRNSLGLD